MFKVITRNSAYTVTPVAGGFIVSKTADMWGREVKHKRTHFTRTIEVGVGRSFATDEMVTTKVQAVVVAK
jgi:hypothetical protein